MLKDWIQLARERGASDLHIETGVPLVLRVRGELMSLGSPIPSEPLLSATRELLGQQLWQDFSERRSVDLSQTISGTRCRINVYQTARGISLAIRLLYAFHNTLKDCNLHPDLNRFVKAKTGLVIVSGPTGSGKSTTLAALIEEINSTERRQILTLESPIEYYFTNRQSFIRQREIESHTPSYEQAIVDAMREDPDVLVISEMRTPDVMRLTLNAAETGHLVLATMHSSTAAEALNRICMSFPAEIQGSVRAQLADCLIGVICQRLHYLPQYQVRVPQCEVLVANSATRATIRNGQMSQILSAIQTGGEDGMWSFERYQRWIDQKRDWVKPKQEGNYGKEEVSHSLSIPFENRRPVQTVFQTVPPGQKTLKKPTQSLKRDFSTGESRIEISAADEDLEAIGRQLAESFGDDDSD
jgi:twitching motility protein PilT